MARWTIAVDPSIQKLAEVEEDLKKANLKVEEVYDFINTLVVSGSKKKVLLQKDKIKGIITIEPEGESTILE